MSLVGARLAGRGQLHQRPVERGIELQDPVVQSLDHPDVPLPVDLAGMEPAPGHPHPVHAGGGGGGGGVGYIRFNAATSCSVNNGEIISPNASSNGATGCP